MASKEGLHATRNGEDRSPETEIDVLKEILKWVKFSGMKEVKSILLSVLDTEQKKTAYQISDGSRGTSEVGKAVGIKSTATVYKLWKQWMKMGLGETVAVKGGERFKRSFSLPDFAIEVNEALDEKESEGIANEEEIQTPESPPQGTLDAISSPPVSEELRNTNG